MIFLCLFLIGCTSNDPTDVPVIGHGGEYNIALSKAEELSKGPLAKLANDEELTEADKQSLIGASAQFQGIIDYRPTAFAPHLANGMIYRALGNLEKAEQHLKQCIVNIPATEDTVILDTSAEAHYQLSRVYFDQEKYEDALAEASSAVQTTPENPSYLTARASALAQLDQLSEAKKDLNAALALDPKHKRANGLKKLLRL